MLSDNIKAKRKAKGLSQEELSVKLNVVRQTVSKWETGLSVPDADMLIALSEALDTPVAVLLGESLAPEKAEDVAAIAERLEVINLYLARKKQSKRKAAHLAFALVFLATVAVFAVLLLIGSPYLGWDMEEPETAVFGAAFHIFEFAFVRLAPAVAIAAAVGAFLTGKKEK